MGGTSNGSALDSGPVRKPRPNEASTDQRQARFAFCCGGVEL